VKIRRHVSRFVALVALLPFLMRGFVVQCAVTDRTTNPSAEAVSITHGAHEGHGGQPCGLGKQADCGTTHGNVCMAMATCATALASARVEPVTRVVSPASLFRTTYVALTDTPQPPDPPPPRA
jgi:hypothetical protein